MEGCYHSIGRLPMPWFLNAVAVIIMLWECIRGALFLSRDSEVKQQRI